MAVDALNFCSRSVNEANKAIEKKSKNEYHPILLLACFSLSVREDEQKEINKWGKLERMGKRRLKCLSPVLALNFSLLAACFKEVLMPIKRMMALAFQVRVGLLGGGGGRLTCDPYKNLQLITHCSQMSEHYTLASSNII